jgi:hypothetical protein
MYEIQPIDVETLNSEKDIPPLTLADALAIASDSERIFALKCLAVGCKVWYQVLVGHSIIDFLVVNPKRPDNHSKKGTLVEVTLLKKEHAYQKCLKKLIRGKKNRTVPNTTGQRKQRQIEAMQASGYHWTILYHHNLRSLQQLPS